MLFSRRGKHKKTDSKELQDNHGTFRFIEEREKIDEIKREELVAVLTATVAACLNQPAYHIRVTSFKRINTVASIWNAVGRKEQLEAKLNI